MESKFAIDLPKLRYMIKQGVSAIPNDKTHQEAVLTIGDTGVGKSTLLSYLNGAKLTVRVEGMKPVIDTKDTKALKIGHERFSETSAPVKVVINGAAFFDCPGFKDNKGEEFEIANSFYIQRLLDIYKKVKILLVIDDSHITEARTDKLPKMLRSLLQSFGTFEDIMEGTVLVINKARADQTMDAYKMELIKLASLKNDNKFLFEEEERRFIDYLIKNNQIVLFAAPEKAVKEDPFPADKAAELFSKIKGVKSIKTRKVKNILSESAKLAIREFIDQIASHSNEKVEELCEEIQQYYLTKHLEAQNDIPKIIALKESVMAYLNNIKTAKGQELVSLLTQFLPARKTTNFQEDFSAVMFFKDIYNKTDQYYSNIINKIYAEVSPLLVKLDKDIVSIQKIEQERAEQQRILDQLRRQALKKELAAKEAAEKKDQQEGRLAQMVAQFEKLKIAAEEHKKSNAHLQEALTAEKSASQKLQVTASKLETELKTQQQERGKWMETATKYQTENEWLKQDFEALTQEYSQAMKELAESSKTHSKKSKYEDVNCPHFKNGGKCVHCIKKWKNEQSKLEV